MEATLELDQCTLITVDELADFMNYGWPGSDWYLDPCHDYRWDQTFTQGTGKELYRPQHPGTVIDLQDYAAKVRWQGYGPDPSRGHGYQITDLVLRWKQRRPDQVLIVQVPKAKLDEVADYLKAIGCLFTQSSSRREAGCS
jgi:hypothetical protein